MQKLTVLCLLAGMAACTHARRDELSSHYSSLTEIDTSNVAQLKVAWTWHTKDADTVNHSQIQCRPLFIDGVLYGTTPRLQLFALDAATGQQRWVFNPLDSGNKTRSDFIMNNNRGVAYWQEGGEKRIFYSAGSQLYAIDAG